jgi:two-component system nitrogen regulation sensor histidine kinase NtrY
LTRLGRWLRLSRVRNAATLGLVVLGPVLAGLTYAVLGPLDQGSASSWLRFVLLADLVYVLAVATLVLRDVARMVAARRAKSAGSRLHLRLVGVFAFLALLPTVTVAIFSVLTINVGLEGWFSDRVRGVLTTSLAAAQAYEEEHRDELARDGLGLAGYLDGEKQRLALMTDGDLRQALGRVQPQIERGLTEAFVIDSQGGLRARGARSYDFGYERPTPEDFAAADADGLAIIEDWSNDEFRALIPLRAFANRYLFVTRAVDGHILSLLDDTQETAALYRQLESDRGRLLFEFGLLYLGFAVILILAAVWLGLWYAEGLSKPVGRLLGASERVGRGDLDVRVPEEDGDDEIADLGRHFNEMTTRLKAQREQLLRTTDQIERRRRLFDSVLSSVTSGVVGLDAEGRVAFANRSAQRLLSGEVRPEIALSNAIPEFAALFERLRAEGRDMLQEQLSLLRGGKQEILLVRMSPRRAEDGSPEGYVVAFDDVTDLVGAQRMAAWGDVARRIAHEIKNPLTPIRLSAERIKRKFGRRLGEDDAADLEQMTDVIVRQTEDLRRIVDEFSRFARMPEPERRDVDLTALVRDAVTLQEAGQPGVRFSAVLPAQVVPADLDPTMISQALTNLIKNAGEAIETRQEREAGAFEPTIQVVLEVQGSEARVTIEDNGIGLPEDRSRLFEPYVTTRDKGTGLGLPIVKKIVEEHGGTLSLEDAAQGRGARAVLRLPIKAREHVEAVNQKQARRAV